jgi:hypothetical protein
MPIELPSFWSPKADCAAWQSLDRASDRRSSGVTAVAFSPRKVAFGSKAVRFRARRRFPVCTSKQPQGAYEFTP